MKKTTEIIIVLDRSGSMSSIRKENISGFNEFLSKQKEENPDSIITMVQFDHRYFPIYEAEPTKRALPLDNKSFVPAGMTALLDAIGKTIRKTVKRHKKQSEGERPEKVLFVIITDGYENSSVKYNREKIFNKIRKMEEKHGWEFVYLGANQDAIHEAANFGISEKKAMTFAYDSLGMQDAFMSLSNNIISFSKSEKIFEFSDEERAKHNRTDGRKNKSNIDPMNFRTDIFDL